MKDNIPFSTGLVFLKNLVKNSSYEYQDSFYIEFEKYFKEEFCQKLIQIFGTVKNLSKETEISYTRLYDQLTRVPMSIEVLNILVNILVSMGFDSFNFSNIEKKILFIKSGGSKSQKLFYPKFPINLKTKEGVRIISHLYHDGGISESSNKQPLYVNQSKKEIEQFLQDSKNIFGDFDRKITIGFGNGIKKTPYYKVCLPTVIGKIFICAGFIPGDKTKNNHPVFDFLINLDEKELIIEYLAKAFNDECHVRDREITLGQSTLINSESELKVSNILLLDKLFLEKIYIPVNGPKLIKIYKNKDGLVAKFQIAIYAKENLKKFSENIILIERKQRKLEKYLIGTTKPATLTNILRT